MKKIVFITVMVALITFGCDFVEKVIPFARGIDTMEIYQQRQDSIRRAELFRKKQLEAEAEQARADSVRKAMEAAEAEKSITAQRYHLIVGAFKNSNYARDFHEKITAQGHDSRIIMSDNNFHLVTIKSFDDYRLAVNDWRSIRQQGEHLVWLYRKEQ